MVLPIYTPALAAKPPTSRDELITQYFRQSFTQPEIRTTRAMKMEVDQTVDDALQCRLGTLSCSDGSVDFHHNDTSLIVSVNGPMEVRMSKESIEKATIEMLYKQKSGLPSCFERAVESQLKSISENIILTSEHPRSSITIVVQEVHNNGSFLASAVNALALALLDASVSMVHMISASACILDTDGKFIVNPTLEEESKASAKFTFVFETNKWDVLSSYCEGRFTKENFTDATKKCRENSKVIKSFMEKTMEKKFRDYKILK